jgi:hypothetical protein
MQTPADQSAGGFTEQGFVPTLQDLGADNY